MTVIDMSDGQPDIVAANGFGLWDLSSDATTLIYNSFRSPVVNNIAGTNEQVIYTIGEQDCELFADNLYLSTDNQSAALISEAVFPVTIDSENSEQVYQIDF